MQARASFGGQTAQSSAITVSTPPTANPPASLTAALENGLNARLSFSRSAVTGDSTSGFKLTYKDEVITDCADVDGSVNLSSPSMTTYLFEGLTADTEYHFGICAFNSAGTPLSSPATTSLTTAPAAPTGLSATVNSASQITLNWTDASASNASYELVFTGGGGGTISGLAGTDTSYVHSGLSASTAYSYSLRAVSSAGSSAAATASATTHASPPPDPSGLAVLSKTVSSITLGWSSGGGSTSGYKLAYQSGASAPANCASGTVVNLGMVVSTTVSSLTANESYSFRLCAVNSNPTPDLSAGVTHLNEAVTQQPPAAPSGLTAVAASTSQINLSWTDNSSAPLAETDFELEQSTDQTNWSATSGNPVANATTASAGSLSAGTLYYFRLRAVGSGGNSSYATTSGTTWSSAPSNPTNFVLDSKTVSSITLDWTSAGAPTTGFKLAYQTGTSAPANCASGTVVNLGNVATTEVTGLAKNQTYSFRLCALNSNPTPDVSTGVTLTSQVVELQAPDDVTDLAAVADGSDTINLSWSAVLGASSYSIWRHTNNTDAIGSWTQLTTNETGTSYESVGLEESSQYYYRIKASNGIGFSPGYDEATDTTGASGPAVHRVFISSTTTTGNIGGVAAADTICQNLANAQSLGGAWKSILAHSANTHASRITITHPIYDMRPIGSGGGRQIASSATQLWSGTLDFPIHYTETGGNSGSASAWTGDTSSHCSDWGSAAGNASFSQTSSSSGTGCNDPRVYWLAYRSTNDYDECQGPNLSACSAARRLYCIEQYPTKLSATSSGIDSIALTWTAVPGASSYTIWRHTNNTDALGSWTQLTSSATGTTYSSTGLSVDTRYYYRIKASNSNASSLPYDEASSKTRAYGHRIFISSTTTNGDMGGVSAADTICQNLANNRALGGAWKSVLAVSSQTIASRITVTHPVYDLRPEGIGGPRQIASTATQLKSQTLSYPIHYNESSISTGAASVWTGDINNHCTDWDSTAGSAVFGETSASMGTGCNDPRVYWLAYRGTNDYGECGDPYGTSCAAARRLYCIEQYPTKLSAAAGGTDTINLTWTAVPGASNYTIWRHTNNTDAIGSWTLLTSTATGTSYASTGLSSATQYYYRIAANNTGIVSLEYDEATSKTRAVGHRIFVTSTTTNGNIGGIAGADAFCQTRANAQSLGGSWKAILATSTQSIADRIDSIVSNPVFDLRPEGIGGPRQIADTDTQLKSQILNFPIHYTESSTSLSNGYVWTGHSGGYHCSNWGATTGNAYYGEVGTDMGTGCNSPRSYWLAYHSTDDYGSCTSPYWFPCSSALRLYCIEQ